VGLNKKCYPSYSDWAVKKAPYAIMRTSPLTKYSGNKKEKLRDWMRNISDNNQIWVDFLAHSDCQNIYIVFNKCKKHLSNKYLIVWVDKDTMDVIVNKTYHHYTDIYADTVKDFAAKIEKKTNVKFSAYNSFRSVNITYPMILDANGKVVETLPLDLQKIIETGKKTLGSFENDMPISCSRYANSGYKQSGIFGYAIYFGKRLSGEFKKGCFNGPSATFNSMSSKGHTNYADASANSSIRDSMFTIFQYCNSCNDDFDIDEDILKNAMSYPHARPLIENYIDKFNLKIDMKCVMEKFDSLDTELKVENKSVSFEYRMGSAHFESICYISPDGKLTFDVQNPNEPGQVMFLLRVTMTGMDRYSGAKDYHIMTDGDKYCKVALVKNGAGVISAAMVYGDKLNLGKDDKMIIGKLLESIADKL
jgi:hypothetical protein